jgi:putative (di)nucleoside polyphosphate hydrolase
MNKKYRPCVGLAIFNASGQVFVGERIDTPGSWQMPQGGIDPGEDIHTAIFREMLEEIGTDKAEIVKILPEKIRYDLPDELIRRLWNGEFQGQEQTWVALRFTGLDSEINLAAHEPPEFSNWKWVELEDTLNMIVPFKRETYKKIIGMLKNIPMTEI